MNTLFRSTDRRIWFTSDTHFGHAKVIEYCRRPFADVEEMNETLIRKWNEKVRPEDLVFHLGDFCFCSVNDACGIIGRLNGQKMLVIGNHDWKNVKSETFRRNFLFVGQQMNIKVDEYSIYLNHFPFLTFNHAYNGASSCWQLFGHVHSGPNCCGGQDCERMVSILPTQYDVGVDNNGYCPVAFETIRDMFMRKFEETTE